MLVSASDHRYPSYSSRCRGTRASRVANPDLTVQNMFQLVPWLTGAYRRGRLTFRVKSSPDLATGSKRFGSSYPHNTVMIET